MDDQDPATDARTPAYVLITPAHNEAAFIGQTIDSVVAQTLRPLKWVIVSDGSTDGTDEIVRRYVAQHEWIQLVRMPEREERHFAGKVMAFNAGYERVQEDDFEVVGSLDADITFDAGYLQFLMGKFVEDPTLGVAGTPFCEGGGATYNYHFTSPEHVSGACQLFRRRCFEAIGGYVPLKVGGIDLVAVTTARMHGWKTRTFTEKMSQHHREMGSANHGKLAASYKAGFHDYLMGVHPVWQFVRSLYQMTRKPWLVGGAFLLAGYVIAASRSAKRPVSIEFVAFRRGEQMRRLRAFLRTRLLPSRGRIDPA